MQKPRLARCCSLTAAIIWNGIRPPTRVLSRHFGQPDEHYEIVHSSLETYLDGLTLVRQEIPLVVEGELREPGLHSDGADAQWLIPGVGSSRVRIKQANAACQSLLCQWAEPVNAFASAFWEKTAGPILKAIWMSPGSGCSKTTRTIRSADAVSIRSRGYVLSLSPERANRRPPDDRSHAQPGRQRPGQPGRSGIAGSGFQPTGAPARSA